MSDSLIPSFIMSDVSELLTVAHQKWAMGANRSGRSPKLSDHEWFAQVTHQKWATMSESLRSLTKNERIAFFWANCSFAHSFAKNDRFAQKTWKSLFRAWKLTFSGPGKLIFSGPGKLTFSGPGKLTFSGPGKLTFSGPGQPLFAGGFGAAYLAMRPVSRLVGPPAVCSRKYNINPGTSIFLSFFS